MTDARITPRSPFVSVQVDVPWELAELIVEVGPRFLEALGVAVKRQQSYAEVDAQARSEAQAHQDETKASWAALADHCEAEIARRSNGPSQRPAIIKQLAAELKLTVGFLSRVIRVHRQERQSQLVKKRTAEIVRLRMQGQTLRRIANWTGVNIKTVQRTLEAETDLIATLRASARHGEAAP